MERGGRDFRKKSMIKIFLFIIYCFGRLLGKYRVFVANYNSDNPPPFRYPNLISLAGYFEYNREIDCFVLKNFEDAELVARKIIRDEITVFELINKKAKRVHLSDFLGYRTSDWEKLKVFLSATWAHMINGSYFDFPLQIRRIAVGDFQIKEDFASLTKFQRNFSKTEAIFIEIKNVDKIFQIGSTLKGTNFAFIDSHFSTLLQELYHCNYHFEEGIRGFNNDNRYIVETWASVPWLYLTQILFGRIKRRVRKNLTPHDIKFIDYVYWRAYIGQGYELSRPSNERVIFHGVYALLAPTARLLFSSIPGPLKEKNNLIIEAIFKGPAPEIRNAVNRFLGGDGCFEKIFYNPNVFDRLNGLNAIIKENNLNQRKIYKILFTGQELVPTILDCKVVALIWLSKRLNSNRELIIDLLENFYNEQLKKRQTICVNDWIKYLELNDKGLADLVREEQEKYQTVINKL